MPLHRRFRLPSIFGRGNDHSNRANETAVRQQPDVSAGRGLILHPEGHALRESIADLRTRLSNLFRERIALEHDVLPMLRDLYTQRFGDLERTIQLRTLEMSERRRIVELISLKLDRGQKIDDKAIDLVVRTVRAEYGRIRARLHGRPSDARRLPDDGLRQDGMGEREQDDAGGHRPELRRLDELRRLYRRLARSFHPDVVGEDPERREIWDIIQRAKGTRDVDLMRTLEQVALNIQRDPSPDIPGLRREVLRLERTLKSERVRIDSIHASELYGMRDQLSIDGFVTAHRDSLSAAITELEDQIARCDQFLSTVLKGKRMPVAKEFREAWSNFVEEMYINRG